jgi:hypothetical protein
LVLSPSSEAEQLRTAIDRMRPTNAHNATRVMESKLGGEKSMREEAGVD